MYYIIVCECLYRIFTYINRNMYTNKCKIAMISRVVKQ